MRKGIAFWGLLLALGCFNLAQGAGYEEWFGPGDVPEEFQPLWDVESVRLPATMGLDEADDSTGYDVTYYNVEIKFPITTPHTITGKVDMRFTVTAGPMSQVNLNLRNNMVVDSVKVNGTTVTSQFVGTDGLRLNLASALPQGSNAIATIWYHGVPILLPPLSSGLAWGTHLSTTIIYSLSEPDASHTWWPCKDVPWDKADSTRMVWTVPSNFTASANGVLRGVTVPQAGWKAYEWFEKYPMVNYLVVVTATNFAHFRNWYVNAGNDSLPLDYYIFPEDSADAVTDFAFLGSVVGYFASVFGEYPYMGEKYGQAAFLWSGGEEHQTLTSVGANLINPGGSYHWLYVHECSHQWWGDMVTCATWMDIFLNEGTATYCDALWTQATQGQAAFINRMNSFRSTYISSIGGEGNFPIYNPTYMWGGTVYQKGAWIEHMLRYIVGETDFWNFWLEWRNRYQYGNATTAEFQQCWEDVSGMDLDWFFNEWVYMAYYPLYQWGWNSTPQGSQTQVNISVKQTQTPTTIVPIFNMPLPFKIVTSGGDVMVAPRDSLAWQNFSFLVNGTVSSVVFDPDTWILKTATSSTFAPVPYTITLSPVSGPVNIPAAGGSFDFNIVIHNNTTSTQNMQGWIMQRTPSGAWQGPMLGAISLSLPASFTLTRTRTQSVPGTAAPGNYLYEGRLGTYPYIINSASNFPYTKLTTGNGPPVSEWLNSGESFDEWTQKPAELPVSSRLIGAFPNPFNPTAAISFELRYASDVRLDVFDISGRVVGAQHAAPMTAGQHQITFDGSNLSSGIYLYRLSAGDWQAVGKMVLMK